MVKIRLTQTGTKNRRTYRLVAIDRRKRRDGRAIENLGFYNPLTKPAHVIIKRDRLNYWLSVGAKLTPSAEKLLREA